MMAGKHDSSTVYPVSGVLKQLLNPALVDARAEFCLIAQESNPSEGRLLVRGQVRLTAAAESRWQGGWDGALAPDTAFEVAYRLPEAPDP